MVHKISELLRRQTRSNMLITVNASRVSSTYGFRIFSSLHINPNVNINTSVDIKSTAFCATFLHKLRQNEDERLPGHYHVATSTRPQILCAQILQSARTRNEDSFKNNINTWTYNSSQLELQAGKQTENNFICSRHQYPQYCNLKYQFSIYRKK